MSTHNIYFLFLIFLGKYILWVLIRSASHQEIYIVVLIRSASVRFCTHNIYFPGEIRKLRRFNEYPQYIFSWRNKKDTFWL